MVSLSDIRRWADTNDIRCLTCGTRLTSIDMKYYPHEDGIKVDRFGRVWIYFECPKCGYQNALWKLLRRMKTRRWSSDVS